MKYIILIILVFVGLFSFGNESSALDSASFNWSLGQPVTVDNTVTTCTTTSTLKYAWTLGEPAPMYDSSSTCGSATPSTAVEDPPIIIISE